ncbi:signal recognition particle-docking protein FtsY [Deferribacterales bacterium Es71-Z0220]|uniref:signal recognition particle-docking protein FtsY n=1 Tax=Deferrivibrio essentukiensis TaxID=2880922 RepID=UPI001F61CCDD|nr:signal recognition particle-docking protein FtsY [Deferrivibrio essentukiensis]MCB4204223.1 signal recognition particle-docking protein FtsY [Deferrivibrio essentukiensis]
MGFFDIFKKKKSAEVKESETDVQLIEENKLSEEILDKKDAEVEDIFEEKPVEDVVPLKNEPVKEDKVSIFKRLKNGLSKTSDKIVGGMESVLLGKKVIDEDLLEELEELFISADVGVATTLKIIDKVRKDVSRKVLKNPSELKKYIKEEVFKILNIDNSLKMTDQKPYVVLVVGVNGAGKTTSIAKLAKMFKDSGLKVLLAAGDTFRAAAIEQLCIWGERVGVPVVKQTQGSDSAAVIFDAVASAKAKGYDVIIADTAGRLHTKHNLMNELTKVKRVIQKEISDAPHEVLLVLDATSGQNAVMQAKAFKSDVDVTGIVLTKLDGTAKGGVIVGIVDELGIPVKFIGFGESMEDLKPFDARNFVDALFDEKVNENN